MKISDITISMKAVDHLKMPELVSSEYAVYLSDEEKERYEEMKRIWYCHFQMERLRRQMQHLFQEN